MAKLQLKYKIKLLQASYVELYVPGGILSRFVHFTINYFNNLTEDLVIPQWLLE